MGKIEEQANHLTDIQDQMKEKLNELEDESAALLEIQSMLLTLSNESLNAVLADIERLIGERS